MRKIIIVSCIICDELYTKRQNPHQRGKNIKSFKIIKGNVRPSNTTTCSRECSKIYLRILAKLSARRLI